MTPQEHEFLKHAQNELVTLCGGIDKAKLVVNYGRSTIARWADVGDPSLMPMAAFLDLQKHCRMPIVTAALAAIENRQLSDPQETADSGQCLYTAMAETIVAGAALNSTYVRALADGKVTPNELSDIDRALARLIHRATESRKVGAASRVAGGLSVVGGAS